MGCTVDLFAVLVVYCSLTLASVRNVVSVAVNAVTVDTSSELKCKWELKCKLVHRDLNAMQLFSSRTFMSKVYPSQESKLARVPQWKSIHGTNKISSYRCMSHITTVNASP